jgi:hypothetical protein
MLADGGLLVFQVPQRLAPLRRLQLARRLYAAARRLGVPERTLLRRTPLTPMRMLALPEREVRAAVATVSGRILRADAEAGRYFAART